MSSLYLVSGNELIDFSDLGKNESSLFMFLVALTLFVEPV